MTATDPRSADFDELVLQTATILADYRREDGVGITADDVAAWAGQFPAALRLDVMRETHAVMDARYLSKAFTLDYLGQMVTGYARIYADGDVPRFLAETTFLNLQPSGKSQRALLALLDEAIAPFGVTTATAGGETPHRYLYLDDVLCSGNTLYRDMRAWWFAPGPDGRPRQESLPASVEVLYHFLGLHLKNWWKTRARFKYDGLLPRTQPQTARAGIKVENALDSGSAMDFAFPRREGLSAAALQYVTDIGAKPEDTFRPDGRPEAERLFTSAEGRDTFERALVDVGLDIIGSVSTHNPNFHPLGYLIKSHKSLGFGSLVFTWRNVANNSPLAFWHDARHWTPLFRKRQADPDFTVLFPDES